MKSFEVENLEKIGGNLDGVVVGKILEIKKHPNADKLRIAKVDVGKEMEVVCGAPNIEVGQKVAVALLGTKLPNGMVMKEVEIRGIKSCGMICAEDELGIGNNHSGILVLDPKSKIGSPLTKELSLEDYTFEIKVLPDRAHDAQSYVGVAREIVALENRQLDYDFDGLILPSKKTKNISIEIKAKELCPRYIGAVMENIEIKESPIWMKNRLLSSGIRPINNIVDATNYVMLELGQPLHAFDAQEISGKKIIIRKAKKGEKITLLDESIKELAEDDLIIADENKALAIAGIMGGQHSGINEKTKTIVLESANFKAISIRKTRTNLNIKTDASDRFEKDIDPNLAEKAMVRLIEIIEHIAGGKLDGIVDIYPKKKKPWTIKLDLESVDKLLGEKVPHGESKKILMLLGFQVKMLGRQMLVTIPTFRIDVKTQEDLIEEIGRIYGYEKIKPIAPLVPINPAPVNEKLSFVRGLKNSMITQGFSEVCNYSFYSEHDADSAKIRSIKHLKLENPMNPDQALMRISLIPNLLKNIRENLKNFKEFNIFEIGNVYHPSQAVLPEEKTMLTGAVVLEKKSSEEENQDKRHASIFFEAKSQADGILGQLGVLDHYYDDFKVDFAETSAALWHESRSAEIKIEGTGETVGFIGEINPLVLERFGLRTRVAMFEFDLQKMQAISQQEREYAPVNKYPLVVRDVSLVAGKDVRVDNILRTIQKAGGNLVLDVDLFDAIDFADNTSSFAFHIIFSAEDRTLTGKEIDDAMNSIMSSLEKDLDIKVRK